MLAINSVIATATKAVVRALPDFARRLLTSTFAISRETIRRRIAIQIKRIEIASVSRRSIAIDHFRKRIPTHLRITDNA